MNKLRFLFLKNRIINLLPVSVLQYYGLFFGESKKTNIVAFCTM
jgi:hypothetical protein